MTMRTFLALAALVAIAGCGGGGTNAVPSAPATVAPGGGSGSTDQVVFSIVIPAQSSSTSSHARAAYVSPNTGSVAITLVSVNGAAQSASTPFVAAVGAHASGCTSAASAVTCTLSVPAPAGNDVFTIATYQSATGSGPVLASTSIAATSPGGTPVALDLGGVPAAIAFSPARLPLVDDGTVQKVAVTVNAADASGAAIVGSAPFQSPVDLQIENDPGGALALSTSSVAQPGTVVTVTYNSMKSLANASIVARDNAMPAATLSAAPLVVSPLPPMVLDDAPSLAISLSEAGFTGSFSASLANAADASLTVTPGAPGSGSAVATVVPHVSFDVTTLNVSDGISAFTVPLQIIPDHGSYSSVGAAHTLGNPSNLVRAANGLLWTGDASNGNLVSFDPSSGTYTSYNVDPTDQGPYGIALDASGNIWFADGPQIGEFNPSTSSIATYTSGLQANAWITSIVAGANGTMWFYDQGNSQSNLNATTTALGTIATSSGAITEYPTSNGAGPVTSALGSTLETQFSMAVASDGSLWFADTANDAIGHLTPGGTIAETKLGGPPYPQQAPQQVVIASGKIWFSSYGASSGTGTIGSLDPSSGNVTYYPLTANQGQATAMLLGSDGNIWLALTPMLGTFHSAQEYLGVVNPSTGAVYIYTSAILPQNTVAASMVDESGTFWILDDAFGNIGKVSFK